jgi:S1-C subfamily serine protease
MAKFLRPLELAPGTPINPWFIRRVSQPKTAIGVTLLFVTLLALTVFFVASVGAPAPAFSQTRDQTTRALLATVQILAPDDELEEISFGSGTILHEDGLILTNHHVVEGNASNGLMNEGGLTLIAVPPDDLRGESVIKYFGTVVKVDPVLDLALIQVSALLDDASAPLPAHLGLTAIERGNSDDLMIADTINIFGYPGIGGNTPTLTRGLVSGFLDDDRDGVYEWIKTDAVLSSGNSGGLATDDQGRFIGVPTAGRVLDATQIGLVRTGALALAFADSYFPAAEADQPAILSMQYATAVNRRHEPINPAAHFASGATDLYAVFQHQNFGDGLAFAAVWRLDGELLARDEFAWDGGRNGVNWVSINAIESNGEHALPDGFLELEILFDNRPLYRGGVTLGDDSTLPPTQPVAADAASFGPITFATGMAGSRPIGADVEFVGLDTVYASFNYMNMVPGTSWNTRWYLNDTQVLEQFELWDGGAVGVYYVTLSHPNGLPVGNYRLELYIQGVQVQSGEFRIAVDTSPVLREVNVTGTLYDRDNQRRVIHGATVMALNPATTAESWLAAGMPVDMILGKGVSNRQGIFRLDTRLAAGESYPLVVMHDHYRTVAIERHLISADAADPFAIDIALQRN